MFIDVRIRREQGQEKWYNICFAMTCLKRRKYNISVHKNASTESALCTHSTRHRNVCGKKILWKCKLIVYMSFGVIGQGCSTCI